MLLERFLIIGADKGIGVALFKAITSQGGTAIRTTRRQGGESFLLDLAEAPENLKLGDGFSCAFLCAARSGFAECEQDPQGTFKVNVEGTLAVTRKLVENGSFVIFLSSSAVFDGSRPWPDESSEHCPNTEYGRQKAIAEDRLLEMDKGKGQVAIVRLTKVLTDETPIIMCFANQILSKSPFNAFSDLKLSPISMPYVVESLLNIASKTVGGIYHLSGDVELSYAALAKKMAIEMKADPAMISETSSSVAKVHFKPKFPGLGMVNTGRTAGLHPEPSDIMLQHLLSTTNPVTCYG